MIPRDVTLARRLVARFVPAGLLLVAIAAALVAPAVAGGNAKTDGRRTPRALVVGQIAPELSFDSIGGTRIATATTLRGRRVWLTFGASWCQPCRVLDADIEAARDRLEAEGITVVAIFIGEDAQTVAGYAGRSGLTFPLVADPDRSLAQDWRVVGIPSHFLIDDSGVLRGIRVGSLDTLTVEEVLGGL